MTATASFTVPAGAWDTHVHIFDNPPVVEVRGRTVPFPHAPAAALDAMLARLGIERAVIVDGKLGGTDFLISALAGGEGRYRGVTLVDDDTSDDDLRRLHDAGVRGARFYFVDFMGPPTPVDDHRRALDRVARMGWHALIFAEPKDLLAHEALLRAAPVPIVLDHLCQIGVSEPVSPTAFELVLDLQRSRDTYVKISAGDRRSRLGPPDYADDVALVRPVIENDPARVIWATDWPHVMYRDPRNPGDPPPDALDILNLLLRSCRSQAEVDLILRDTPAKLYA